MQQQIEQIIRESLPKERVNPKPICMNAETAMFGRCFDCEKNKGYDQALSDLSSSIPQIAERIVEEIKKEIDEIHTELHNGRMDTAYEMTCKLLSTLTTSKK